MKDYFISHVLPFSWEHIVRAYWQKYPNTYSKHVISEDTLSKQISDSGSKLKVRRAMQKIGHVPTWAERFISNGSKGFVIEDIVVNTKSKTMTIITQNLSFRNIMIVEERCEYKPVVDHSNPDVNSCIQETLCTKTAKIKAMVSHGIGFALERLGIGRYSKYSERATQGLLQAATRMYRMNEMQSRTYKGHCLNHACFICNAVIGKTN
ncbi:hypothetical protein GJ496_001742 [Pomphorhynchus laevis]|nr:hypothetical protein GJ496_001742 [Pomphorhynchus laevis]